MRYQWVKVLMKKDKPYYVKVESETFIDSKPYVDDCLKKQGISLDNIDRYMVVTGPGRAPKTRNFHYKRREDVPIGQIRCESCKKVVPEDTNICVYFGAIFNKRLIELTNNGSN